LFAKIYQVEINVKEPRTKEGRREIAMKAKDVPIKEFTPNDMKANQIQSQVEKEESKEEESKEEAQSSVLDVDYI